MSDRGYRGEKKENLRGYYAAISAMDAGVGKILDKVKEKGLEDNTIVILRLIME